MLDQIQFLLSLEICGFCVFGGTTLLFRARENRAKRILGWSMFLWAILTAIRMSINVHIEYSKEVFHPVILISGCFVTVSLACYVIEVLRPGYLTLKRSFLFVSPIMVNSLVYLIYRLSGNEIHVFYSVREFFVHFNLDVFLRLLILLSTFFYMILPVYLVMRYSKGFTFFLMENVSDPEDYDLGWLRKIMLILSAMYISYLFLLFTDSMILYVVNKVVILMVWYYFFYKALFLKSIHLGHTFEKGWDLPYITNEEGEDEDEEQKNILFQRYAAEVNTWFQKEKPYLREDLRLSDLQRVFPMSRSYLSQLFNRELGCSFSDYVNGFRIEESKRLLDAEPTANIQDIAERSGFHSISTFRRAFTRHTGVIPSEYRKG